MIETERIEALARAMDGSPVTELVVVQDGLEIRFTRAPVFTVAAANTDTEELPSSGPVERPIGAPRVGVYHHPQRPVHAGDRIEAGEIVGVIEAMRILNEVTAPFSGVVSQVLVEDGTPVDYGQELLLLKVVAG